MQRVRMVGVCVVALIALACEGANDESDLPTDASSVDCGDLSRYWEHSIEDNEFTVISIAAMSDGGFSVGGWIPLGQKTLGYVLRLDQSGAQKWMRPMSADTVNAVAEIPEGRLVVAGEQKSFGTLDATVAIIEQDGTAGIETAFQTSGGDDRGVAVAGLPGGGVIAVLTVPNPAVFGAKVIVASYSGGTDFVWSAEKTLPNLGPHDGAAIAATHDGGAVATWTLEKYFSGSGDTQVYLMRVHKDGKILVAEEYGTSAGERVYALAQAPGGEFVAGGCIAKDGKCRESLLVSFFKGGNVRWEKKFHEDGEEEEVRAIVPLSESGFIAVSFAQETMSALRIRRVGDDGAFVWTTSAGRKRGEARVALSLDSGLIRGAVAETDAQGSRVRTFAVHPETGAFCE